MLKKTNKICPNCVEDYLIFDAIVGEYFCENCSFEGSERDLKRISEFAGMDPFLAQQQCEEIPF